MINAIYFEGSDPGPHIAINFLNNKELKPPVLFKSLQPEVVERVNSCLEEEAGGLNMSTCMCYCANTNQVIVGTVKGEVLVYSIVSEGGEPFCQLDYKIVTVEEGPVLCVEARAQIAIITLFKMRFVDINTQKTTTSKKQPEQVDQILNLFSWINDTKCVMSQKDLVILKDVNVPTIKKCKLRIRTIEPKR